MVERDVTIRLSLKDGEKVEDRLKKLGTRGQRALAKIERSSKPASKSLLVLNRASGQLQSGMAGLAGRAGGLGGALGALGPAGLAAGAAMGAAALSMRAAIQAAREAVAQFSELANTADKLGLTVETLQELRFAAEQVGVSSQTLDLAMQRFTRRVAEAAQGTGELKPVLDQYNIAVRDAEGNMRPVVDILGDLADATANAKRPQEQLRIAFKAFDSEGAALVNVLREGRDGLADYAQQARAAGIVVDDHIVRKAQEAGDELNRLEQENKALLGRIGVLFTDWLTRWEQIRKTFLEIVAGIIEAQADVDSLSRGAVVGQISDVEARLTEIGDALAVFDEKAKGAGPIKLAAIEDARAPLLAERERQMQRLLDLENRLQEIDQSRDRRENNASGGGTGIDVTSSAEVKKVEGVVRGLEGRLAALRLQAKAGAAGDLAAAQAKALQQAGLENAPEADARVQKIRNLVAAVEALTGEEKRLKDIEQQRTSLIGKYMTAEERRQKLLKDAPGILRGAKDAEIILARIRKEVADERLKEATDFSSGAKRAFQDLAKEAADSAALAEEAIRGGFEGAKDAIRDFVKTGRLDLERFSDAAIRLFADIAARQLELQVVNPFLKSIGFLAADGAVLDHGRPTPFAAGGVVDRPTVFPMAKGDIGLMGEAGPEAIMPLERMGDGALGVRAAIAGAAAPADRGPRIVFAPVIQVGGGQGGSAEQNRELAEAISERLRREFENVIDERLSDNLRPGGLLDPFGAGRHRFAG